jgi:hypothetical protein
MVVIRGSDSTIKGHVDRDQWPTSKKGVYGDSHQSLSSIRLTRLDSGAVEDVSLASVKAVFFVRDFAGEVSHTDLRFHDHLPVMECLWVRVRFNDGEMIEGIINNTQDYVLESGFFMAPADPLGNNWLIYVLKSKLTDFEILGLRPKVKSLLSLNATA